MSGDGIPGLAEKLNHLFATVPAPTRSGLYSNDSASHALEERGITVSGVHISHLRSGRRDNPAARLLAGLADLFGVPIGYFFDTTMEDRINAELEALTALKDSRPVDPVGRSSSALTFTTLEIPGQHLFEPSASGVDHRP